MCIYVAPENVFWSRSFDPKNRWFAENRSSLSGSAASVNRFGPVRDRIELNCQSSVDTFAHALFSAITMSATSGHCSDCRRVIS